MSSKEQRKIVREFLKWTYKVNVDQIQTAVMNEYIDYRFDLYYLALEMFQNHTKS